MTRARHRPATTATGAPAADRRHERADRPPHPCGALAPALRVPFGRRAVLRGRLTLPSGSRWRSPVRRSAWSAACAVAGRGCVDARAPSPPTAAGASPRRCPGRPQPHGRPALRRRRGAPARLARHRRAGAGGEHDPRLPDRARADPAACGFSGRLRTGGQAIPDRGLIVVLQGRASGALAAPSPTPAPTAAGRWSASYRFRGICGTYPVRARIRRQAGYPFELGHSRRVTVRVR